MTIPVLVTKKGADSPHEHAIEMGLPVEQWKAAHLHEVCNKMAALFAGSDDNVVRTREDSGGGDGYIIAVQSGDTRAETITALPLSAALAADPLWEEQA